MTDWNQRELCPDGNCIGVIGPEGTCKVCGRAAPNWGDERRRGLAADASATAEDEEVEDEDSDSDGDDGDSDGDDGDDSDADETSDEHDEEDGDDSDDEDGDEGDDESDDESDDEDDDDDEGEAEGDEDGAIAAKAAVPEHATKGGKKAGDWQARALCPDGGCIGVIGPDGTCKVCGKRAA